MSANLRVLLWVVAGAALFLNYQTWQHDYAPVAPPLSLSPSASARLDANAPTASAPAGSGGAGTEPAGAAAGSAPLAAPLATSEVHELASMAAPAAGSVHVVTDVLDVQVGLEGGELERADLRAYPQVKDKPDVPVRLLNRDSADSLFVVQGGLAGTDAEQAPTHRAIYSAAVTQLRLASGEQTLRLPLSWSDGHGVTVTKTLIFNRADYRIGVEYEIHNASSTPWTFAPYAQILRYNVPVERSYFRVDSYAFKGPAIFDGRKYEKLDITKGATLDQLVSDGWIAALQQHFVVALVPPAGALYGFSLKHQGNEFLLSATGPSQTVPVGASAAVASTVWVGPKLQSRLDQVGPKLSLVTDYGKWFSVLAQPLFWLLDHVHALVGNWGFTIIIVTLLLKLLFYPLSEASGRSMAKMKALAPRLTALRETYKDDRDKLNRAMMELYQREKINPLAGCLPTLIQIPVFLSFYWVLRDSVEIRQAPFIFWINDLSARDPLFILPALMAGAMFVQYKLNPQVSVDPMQQKLFMFMPLAMSVTFAFFPAGLVLYWVTNTVLSILQQWNINRRIGDLARSKR